MNVQTEKIALAKRLLETDDEAVLNQIKQIFESQEKDFWNDLPEQVKEGISRAQKQAAAGKLTSHDEVMKKYTRYL
jgi:hypothetical protein